VYYTDIRKTVEFVSQFTQARRRFIEKFMSDQPGTCGCPAEVAAEIAAGAIERRDTGSGALHLTVNSDNDAERMGKSIEILVSRAPIEAGKILFDENVEMPTVTE